ncbi:MAG: hypothetical protein HQL84_16110 [Magnetococcales bacterium]|nr:hypothetical protein [Magnetococcales bacterium]MBF0151545.1 hypothetical protein [Magnetococcales bacterium]
MGLSVRQYADHRGVSHVAVLKAIKSGRIRKEADGTIDPKKADSDWDRNTDPAQQRTAEVATPTPRPVPRVATSETELVTGNPSVPNYHTSRAIREAYNARLIRLDYEERQGKLLKAEDVERDAFEMARRVRDRLMNIPHRMAAVLASESDSQTIERQLDQELRIALEELSR